MQPQKAQTYLQKRAVVMEPDEKNAVSVDAADASFKEGSNCEEEGEEEGEVGDKRLEKEAKKGEKDEERKKEVMRIAGQKSGSSKR
jgi:ribosome biogenesis protein BMS1